MQYIFWYTLRILAFSQFNICSNCLKYQSFSSIPNFPYFKFRSNSSEVFYKIGVFKIFAEFTGKHLCQTLF